MSQRSAGKRRRIATMLAVVLSASLQAGARADQDRIEYFVAPRDTDPAIARGVADNVVIYRESTPRGAPLLIFLPPTFGRPVNLQLFLDTASRSGYRAIGLMYDDAPSADSVCPQDPNPNCSQQFHQKRVYGDPVTGVIHDAPAESIVNRLVKLLAYLDAHHPGSGWNDYLTGRAPNWSRIAIGGHSQGAGMAAFIAKSRNVRRVVLFSSPWDYHAANGELASWLLGPSATPLDRWYGAYHARERMAQSLARSYAALQIPRSHVCVLALDPRGGAARADENPNVYHNSVVGDRLTPLAANATPAYLPDWQFLLGEPSGKTQPPRPPSCG